MKGTAQILLGLVLAVSSVEGAAAEGPASASVPTSQVRARAAPVTVILSALSEETASLERSLAEKQERKIQGIRFVAGKIGGRHVVLVAGGMGKVNAAVVATLAIDHFQPSEVLFSGIAGCLNPGLGLGDIVIAERTVQHDLLSLERQEVLPMEIFSPIDGTKNPEYFPADARLLKVAQTTAAQMRNALEDKGLRTPTDEAGTRREHSTPQIVTGLVVTGDMFVGANAKKAELQERYHADAVDMEGAAVAQVCYQFRVPCLIIRCVSDLADDAADADVEAFMHAAAQNVAVLVRQVVADLDKASPAVAKRLATSRPAGAIR